MGTSNLLFDILRRNLPRRLAPIAIVLAALLALLLLPPGARAANIRYAKPSATGTGDCSSWANACTLQTALTGAAAGDEIWVMAGTHKPTTNGDRNATFQLKSGVGVYGGFAGSETARSQRDWTTNVTTLSGDIGSIGTTSDNSYHVVTGSGTDSSAVLDGVTITGGNDWTGLWRGGGMYNSSGSPTVSNVIFDSNTAFGGGGMFNDNSSPTLTNVTFRNNTAMYGGGLRNDASSPTLTNVTFSGNTASQDGGGVYNYSGSPTLTNVTFSGNSADYAGGGLGGGSPTLTNVTFSGNSSPRGGAVFGSGITARNTLFVKGATGDNCWSVLSVGSANNLADDGTCYTGTTNSASINLGALGSYGGATQTFPLNSNSSAIDAGNPTYCPATDQRGQARDDLACDAGAYELKLGDSSTVILTPSSTQMTTYGPTRVGIQMTEWTNGIIRA